MNRGWIAALTVTITLTLTLLAVEKYFSGTSGKAWELAKSAAESVFLNAQSAATWTGIHLEADSRVILDNQHSPNPMSGLTSRRQRLENRVRDDSSRLRRPPEPAANAVLCEPLSADDFVSLPLTHASSSLGFLMESMDTALNGPMKMVSTTTAPHVDELRRMETLANSPGQGRIPSGSNARMPVPTQLYGELTQLDGIATMSIADPRYVSSPAPVRAGDTAPAAPWLANWVQEVQSLVNNLVSHQGLESSESGSMLEQLSDLALKAFSQGELEEDYGRAQAIIRTAYSLQRRTEIWKAVQRCLDDGNTRFVSTRSAYVEFNDVQTALADVERLLAGTHDAVGWRKYLMIDEFNTWLNSEKDRETGNSLAQRYLSRIRSSHLQPAQVEFLRHPAIERMSVEISLWNREPIDYRHLLTSLELVEQAPESRAAETVAEMIQTMRNAAHPGQQQLAALLNTHYRNANIRLTISKEFIERFLPEQQVQHRSIRQSILGANTSGDSAIQTKILVNLLPDPNAWNLELGVVGELVSQTQSSKGPAVFHNTGFAHVESQRYLRLGTDGYRVSSAPTHVSSQDFLNKMSTDFDGLPVIGHFARMIVREQFNQKRGLAKRVTQRKIAQETDLELDRRIEEALQQSEKQLQERILGPLQRMALDPVVVSMSTTEERLSIRYRLAHERQLTAFTPRPRAPADNLMSLQLHQSTLNNLLDRLELSGRTWRLAELYQHLGSLFNRQWEPPQDVPDDITLRFADRTPISVELLDGQLRLKLRFAEFQRDEGIPLKNFAVTSSYLPVAQGMMAGLVRDPDGVIEIQGKHLTIRERLALRVIFAKVFVSQPEISFVSEQWRDDPKAQNLGISQMSLRDGWLAVAISASENPLVMELARQSAEVLTAVNR